MMRYIYALCFRFLSLAVLGSVLHATEMSAEPWKIKAVVVTMFEIGEDTGDIPGEFQRWVERGEFDHRIDFPLGLHDIYHREDGVMVICTAGGVTNATATIMALGQDPRFDLSQAYWVIAGIAGADPQDCSLGSAAWAKWVVDGDLAYEIDGREIPEDWEYGFIALGAEKPNTLDNGWTVETIAYKLNSGLVEWAFDLTKEMSLPDHPELAEFREQFLPEQHGGQRHGHRALAPEPHGARRSATRAGAAHSQQFFDAPSRQRRGLEHDRALPSPRSARWGVGLSRRQ